MADKLASLEVTVLSAEGLSLSRRSVKKNAFVTVRTDSHHCASTNLDTDGGSFPQWNEKLCLPLPRSTRSIAVEVRCKAGPELRTLGLASIPVSDFYGGVLPPDYLHFLSYRLRDTRGERNGIINLSIRARGASQQPNPRGLHPPPPPLVPAVFSWASGAAHAGDGVAVGIPVAAQYQSLASCTMEAAVWSSLSKQTGAR